MNIILVIITAILAYITGIVFLKIVKTYELHQPIYEDAPERHQKKAGTPTLGAVVFLVPYLIISFLLIFITDTNIYIKVLLLIAPIGFLSIGIFDDLGKIRYNSNTSGLSPRMKLILQLLTSIVIIIFLYLIGIDTTINFIFFEIDFKFFYPIILILMFLGYSNASNLTDGLDGLLSSVTIVLFSGILAICIINKEMQYVPYLIIFITGLLVFLLAFNKHPAKMFMGDTGSLTIGGMYILFLALLKVEFIGALLAVIYLAEVISVMLQTSYFKYTKKKTGEGKRIFKMAPLHHHYEQKGNSENKIVLIFSFIQLLATILFVYLGTL